MPVYIIFQTDDVLSTAASSGGTHPGTLMKEEHSPSVSESRVSNFLCLLL